MTLPELEQQLRHEALYPGVLVRFREGKWTAKVYLRPEYSKKLTWISLVGKGASVEEAVDSLVKQVEELPKVAE